ncbi:MAG: sodium:proton antiporter [Holosporaceae bacterium]|nr:MAG: sodium:proton antiporter [Holosporaceae bacterium]
MQANAWRKNKAHIFIFFIFLVSNIEAPCRPWVMRLCFWGLLKAFLFMAIKKFDCPHGRIDSLPNSCFFFIIDSLRFKKRSPTHFSS